MKKVLSMLVVLSLVMSLFSGFMAAPKTVSAAEGASLAPVVNIVYAPTGTIAVGSTFYVDAAVANAAGGSATISFDSGVKLVAGETATKPVGTDSVGDVWWKLQCTATGVSTITVASGTASDSVKVTQGVPPVSTQDFTITWMETPCVTPFNGKVAVGSLFSVKALVHYNGTGLSDPVSLKLTLGPDIAFVSPTPADGIVAVGPMSSSRDEVAGWNLQCTGETLSTFVAVSLYAPADKTADVPDPCRFQQGNPTPEVEEYWDSVIYSPEKVAESCGDNLWDVRTVLTNETTESSAGAVYAKLTVQYNNPTLAVLATGEESLQLMTGTMPIAPDGTAEATWKLMALHSGTAHIQIDYYDSVVDPHDTLVLTKTFTVEVKNYLVTIGDLTTGTISDPNNTGNLIPDPLRSVYADPADMYQFVNTNAQGIHDGDPAYVANDNPIIDATTEECKLFTVKTTFENTICYPVGDGVSNEVRVHIKLPSAVAIAPYDPANPSNTDWRPIHVAEYVRDQTTGEVSPKMGPTGPIAYDLLPSAVVFNSASPNDGYLTLPTNCACCIYVVTWKLQCTGSSATSPVTFSSELWSIASNQLQTTLDSAYFTLTQESAPNILTSAAFYQGWLSDDTLTTNPTAVIAAPCSGADPTAINHWTLVIPVMNTGDVAASPLNVVGGLTGDFTISQTYWLAPLFGPESEGASSYVSLLVSLPGHSTGKLIVEGICTGDTNLAWTFTSVTGTDSLTGASFSNLTNGACGPQVVMPITPYNLAQIPFTFTIVEPTKNELTKMVSSNYVVKVLVSYCGNGDPKDPALSGLHATLAIDGQAELVDLAGTESHALGDLSVTKPYAETLWNVHCTGIGEATFTVTLTADAIPAFSMTQSATVTQTASSSVTVNILSPTAYETYATGQQFAITAQVCCDPESSEDATGLEVALHDDFLDIISAPTMPTTTMKPGDCVTLTWTVRANPDHLGGPDDGAPSPINLPPEMWAMGGFSVVVSGTNIDPAGDTVAPLIFYKAAYLVTTITGLTDAEGAPITDDNPVLAGSDFYLCGTIANIGWADATSVRLHVDVVYGDVAPAAGSSYDYLVRTVPAQRGDSTLAATPFCIKLQSEKAGKVSLKLTASGEDEYGIHWGPMEQQLISIPLYAIPQSHCEYVPVNGTITFVSFVSEDSIAPVITPTAGQDGATVNDPHFTLTGTVTDNVGVASFYIGTAKVDVLPDGTFAYPVTLAEGANTFTYKAFDAANNMATTTITVTYEVPADPLLKTVTLSYIEGWNLVTVPLNSTTLSGLAGDANFTGEIYGYSQTNGWFIPTGFEAGQAYWLNMKAAGTATIYGYEVASPQLKNYASGWVLIGSPYSVGGDTVRVIVGVNPPMLLKDAVAGGLIGNIFYFDGTWKAFDAATDAIQPGLGYWVEVKAAASIVFVKP